MSSTTSPRPRGKGPTQRDVAALAAVDPSAVSRHINGDPSLNIPDETRARIDAAIAELDYRPNLAARSLRMARSWSLGLLLPDLTNPMYQTIIEGVTTRAAALGYDVVLGNVSADSVTDQPRRAIDALIRRTQVEGVLITSGSIDDATTKSLTNAGHKIVAVNRRVEGVTSVVLDDEAGSRHATQVLRSAGHSQIGVVLPPGRFDSAERRMHGFRSATSDLPEDNLIAVPCEIVFRQI